MRKYLIWYYDRESFIMNINVKSLIKFNLIIVMKVSVKSTNEGGKLRAFKLLEVNRICHFCGLFYIKKLGVI